MVLDKENKIAYLKFPANKDEVRKVQADGYEIIDIRYKPDDEKGADEKPVASGNGKDGKAGAGTSAAGGATT